MMKLATYIQENLEPILLEWDTFAGSLFPAAASPTKAALRDHARQILLAITADMQTHQTPAEQKQKSLGHDADTMEAQGSAASIHGGLRHAHGFDLVQLVAEYRALRASVLRLWARHEISQAPGAIDEVTRFNEAMDQAVAESVCTYSDALANARDTFMAILGHDLRSPLSAIVMSAHNIASSDLPPATAHSVAIIQRSALSMQVMIRDLLDFASSRLGRDMPMQLEDSSLEETCQVALTELMAAHPGRTFEFEKDGDLRGHYDPARIGQILSNLLNNAVNHGDGGQPVRVRARATASELTVEVANKGKTLSPEALQAIMDPLTTTQIPGSQGSSGLGLGLYIAREIAEAHGGSVTATSEDGATRFLLHLPRRPSFATAPRQPDLVEG